MEDIKNLSFTTSYEVDGAFDSEKFIKMKLRVCHNGINPNGSSLETQTMVDAESSVYNIPILAKVRFDEDGQPQFMAHEMSLQVDYKDDIRLVYEEIPIGVVPESALYEIKEYDGKDYAYVDAYIWKGYSNYAEDIILRDEDIKLSMEISVDDAEFNKEKSCYDIKKYRYTGITFLGNDKGTGMLNALATTNFSEDDAKQKMIILMESLKQEISVYNKNLSKGGRFKLNDELRDSILAEFKITLDELDFEISEDMTEEVFKAKVSDFACKKKEYDNKEDTPSEDEPKTEPVAFSATYNQKREAICNALPCEVIKDEKGNYVKETYYWLVDFDESYVYVEQSIWEKDCDYSSKNGRFTYSFDELSNVANVNGEFEEMIVTWLTLEEKQKVDASREAFEVEYKELKTFKENTIKEQFDSSINELFTSFEDQLKDVEEFDSIKSNHVDMTYEAIEEKLYALVGKKNAKFSSKQKKTVNKIPCDKPEISESDSLYGGLFAKYNK